MTPCLYFRMIEAKVEVKTEAKVVEVQTEAKVEVKTLAKVEV